MSKLNKIIDNALLSSAQAALLLSLFDDPAIFFLDHLPFLGAAPDAAIGRPDP
jgi:hypothetical protein